jgi:hypothetical protein
MALYRLTDPQRDALISVAQAMLAGPEGEGDAEGVSFAVLRRAALALVQPVKSKAQGEAAVADDSIGSVRVSPAIYDDERDRWTEYTRHNPDLIFTASD